MFDTIYYISERIDFMSSTLLAYLISAGAVTLAEMGDKTQLLAMAFATKYKASKVLIGVFIATIFNHALAVALGNFVSRIQSLEAWIQGIAALSFIFFGLWTIRGDKLEGEENRKSRFGDIATVTIAFFIAELGDKTQLATIALATKFPADPVGILMGTTTGMLIADAIGICIGIVMCKRIPEKTVKLVSAAAFMLFGFIGCFQVAREKLLLSTGLTSVLTALLIAVTTAIALPLIKKARQAPEEENVITQYCRIKTRKESYEGE